jgi:hypothetical protein
MATVVEKIRAALLGTGNKKRDQIVDLPEGFITAADVHLVDDPEQIEEMKKPKAAKPRL